MIDPDFWRQSPHKRGCSNAGSRCWKAAPPQTGFDPPLLVGRRWGGQLELPPTPRKSSLFDDQVKAIEEFGKSL